jgi:hypothetical protein
MSFRLRGALIEYGSGLMGPIPNVVIFQFNPESLSRTLRPPSRPQGSAARETSQAGDKTVESFSFKAHFSAADLLAEDKILARTVGLGPQLAALEKMAQPSAAIAGAIGAALDAIGGALGLGSNKAQGLPIPREKYPKVLFLWGLTRVLPVTIDSMQINEPEFDFLLNPIRAEVDLTLTVNAGDTCEEDLLAKGALMYSSLAKEVMAMANLANTVEQIAEIIPL